MYRTPSANELPPSVLPSGPARRTNLHHSASALSVENNRATSHDHRNSFLDNGRINSFLPRTSSGAAMENGNTRTHYSALEQIRESLQPYAQQQQPFDPAPSTPNKEQHMLHELVSMGFDKEDAFCALKLTQFRGIQAAVEILIQAKPQPGYREKTIMGGVENGGSGMESGSSRSESPLTGSGSYYGRPGSSPNNNGALQSRVPSPFSPYASPGQSGTSKRSHVSLCLQQPTHSDYAIHQYSAPVVPPARSTLVRRPVAQSAVTPTVVNVGLTPSHPGSANPSPHARPPTKVFSAHLDSASVSRVQINVQPTQTSDGHYMNYHVEASAKSGEPMLSVLTRGAEVPAAGIQRITIDDGLDPSVPPDKQYIESLIRRVSQVLGHQSPLDKRDSTASSTSDSFGTDSFSPSSGATERPFAQLVYNHHGRNSPVSSLSTESSAEGAFRDPPERSTSPLPSSVCHRIHSGTFESVIKPCTAKAFRFFMEQHVENVVKQYEERVQRARQLEQEMVSADFDNPTQCQMRRLLAEKESRYLRQKRQRLSRSIFEKIAEIGKGAFGKVFLVRKKDTKALYAMKRLQKKDVLVRNQAAHVKAERDILSEADNEWVVKLYYSFQDRDSLFLIMEYIPGGDMMNLLIKEGIFCEDLARFYIAELVCAIESVHKLQFIHRDIKPDNILIDRSGHIKLTDFGLCTGLRWTHDNKYYNDPMDENLLNVDHLKQDSYDLAPGTHKLLPHRHQRQRQTAHSLVGTPNYIAPEVLLRIGKDKEKMCLPQQIASGHTQLCDWWSVGVILYEMVIGRPPFCADTPAQTQYKIINWKNFLHIPRESDISNETRNIIVQLCRDTETRLGKSGGAQQIKSHPYFKGIDFAHLRESRAPYVPTLLSETDTSHFDTADRGDSQCSNNPKKAQTKRSEGKESENHAFYEFTFRRFFDSDPLGCPTIRKTPPRPSLAPLMESNNNLLMAQHPDPASNVSVVCISNEEEEDDLELGSSGRRGQSSGGTLISFNGSSGTLTASFRGGNEVESPQGPGRPDREASDSSVYV